MKGFGVSINSTIFTNNHFALVEEILSSRNKVIIFLVVNNDCKDLSFEHQKAIIESYFTKEQLTKIKVIYEPLNTGKDVLSLINTINGDSNEPVENLTLFLDISLKEAVKELNLDNKTAFFGYFRPAYEEFSKTGVNVQSVQKPLYNVNVKVLESYNLCLNAFKYILEHNLLFTEQLKALVKGARLKHSISVGSLAYEIAEANNLDNPAIYFLTGLLHDIGKQADGEVAEEIMQKYFKEYVDLPKFAYHQYVGAYFAYKYFNIKEENILKAIIDHCTGNTNMSPLGKVIYASDKIDPLRGYDSSDMIRAMKENYKDGFLYVVRENLIYIENKSNLDLNEFDRVSKSFFKFYLNK